jgi:hypothetical protein
MNGEAFYSCFMGDKLREYREEFGMLAQASELRQADAARRMEPDRPSLTSPIAWVLERLTRSIQMHSRPVKSWLTGHERFSVDRPGRG